MELIDRLMRRGCHSVVLAVRLLRNRQHGQEQIIARGPMILQAKSMRAATLWILCLMGFSPGGLAQVPAATAPLPNPAALLQRAIANEKTLATEQERYDCWVADQVTETDKNGKVKKSTLEVNEEFFVNGIPIDRALSKNGKDLSPDEVKKQNARVMKETLKYSNQSTAQKENDKYDQQLEDFLAAMMLANGRRQIENGLPPCARGSSVRKRSMG